MYGFISTKKLIAKSIFLLIIFSILFLGLYLFTIKKDFLFSYQPYYFKAYYDGIRISHQNSDLTVKAEGDARSVPVLLYHGLVNKPDQENVTLKTFEDQMVSLKKEGYQTITLSDFQSYMQEQKKLPEKSFLLTFDDGRKDSYYTADPILKALNFNAVMFAIAGHNNSDQFYLSDDEYKDMINSGRWEIASHGFDDHGLIKTDNQGSTGYFLSSLMWLEDKNRPETLDEYKARIQNDLSVSKQTLEAKYGTKVIGFAFPFGDFLQNSSTSDNRSNLKPILLDTVTKIYPLAFFQISPDKGSLFNFPDKSNQLIKRIEPDSSWGTTKLVNKLEFGQAKDLPLVDNFPLHQNIGWFTNWGTQEITQDGLKLSSTENTTGASTHLDGSNWWQNYNYSATLDWTKGSNLMLIARYQDNDNYIATNFNGNTIRIEQMLNGQNTVLSETKIFPVLKHNLNIGINVNGDVVMAAVGKDLVVSAPISNKLSKGGIGILVWDTNKNNASVNIKQVNVRENK